MVGKPMWNRQQTSLQQDKPTFFRVAAVLSALYVAAIVIPLYSVIVSAFKTNAEIFDDPLAPPTQLSLDQFQKAQEAAGLLGALFRSTVVVVLATAIVLALALLAGYAIARIPSRSSKAMQAMFGLGFLIPAFALLVPVFIMAARSGLLNNPLFLILFYPATRLPLSIFMLVAFIQRVPIELEESAEIDGAGRLAILTRIVVPLIRPGLATVVILNFITLWNEFLFALVLTDSSSNTIQVALGTLNANIRRIDFSLIAAAILVSVVPVYVMFIFFQRRVIGAFADDGGKL